MGTKVIDTYTILLSGLTALIGAFIGVFGGTFLIKKNKETEMEKIREIAIKGLNVIKKYADSNNTYCNAQDEFNTTLKIAEKRAVLVCLHKLGIPIEWPVENAFDIKKIRFLPQSINKGEIEGMVIQINSGHCDNLFFLNVDTYLTENAKIKTLRSIGIKYVTDVFSESEFKLETNKIVFPENWFGKFSYGEVQSIMVFRMIVMDAYFFDNQTGKPKVETLNQLKKDIELGLWDSYLQWDYSAYENMLVQKESASRMIGFVSKLESGMNFYQQNSMSVSQSSEAIDKEAKK